MNKEKISPFILPIICILLGVLTFITADSALKMICIVAAIAFILQGILSVVKYFRTSPKENLNNDGFVLGFAEFLFGVFAIARVEYIVGFLPFALGFLICINGLRELQNAIDVHRLGLKNQWIVVIIAIINLVAGFVLMINPGMSAAVLMKVIGCCLMISGFADMITGIIIHVKSSKLS